MHIIGIDQNDVTLRRDMLTAGAIKTLGTLFNNANTEGVMHMAGKTLTVIARLQHF